jgi:cell division protein FtsN
MSEDLDEERREMFQSMKRPGRAEPEGEREAQIQRERDEELARQRMEEEKRTAEAAKEDEERSKQKQDGKHKKTSSELDYGIESSNPNDSSKSRLLKGSTPAKPTSSSRSQFPPTLTCTKGQQDRRAWSVELVI